MRRVFPWLHLLINKWTDIRWIWQLFVSQTANDADVFWIQVGSWSVHGKNQKSSLKVPSAPSVDYTGFHRKMWSNSSSVNCFDKQNMKGCDINIWRNDETRPITQILHFWSAWCMFYNFEFISHFWIFAAFVPLIKNLPRVRMMGLSASGILSGVMKKRFFEVRWEQDAQCTLIWLSVCIKFAEIDLSCSPVKVIIIFSKFKKSILALLNDNVSYLFTVQYTTSLFRSKLCWNLVQ